MPSDNTERSRRATIAALARVAREPSGTAMTARARSAFLRSFYEQTDPELPEAERQRQAAAARRLYFTRLSQRAALARQRASTAMQEHEAAVAQLADSADAV